MSGEASSPAWKDDMTGTAHKELIRRLESAMNRRALAELDAFMAPDFTRICEATPDLDIHDLEGFKTFLADYAVAFPDNIQTFTHVAADGDLIGVYATYEGTHLGPLGPVPATGKRVEFDFAGMFTVRDDKLAEFRVTWDNQTILGQLGLLANAQ
jgi:predicted ester cyclase